MQQSFLTLKLMRTQTVHELEKYRSRRPNALSLVLRTKIIKEKLYEREIVETLKNVE